MIATVGETFDRRAVILNRSEGSADDYGNTAPVYTGAPEVDCGLKHVDGVEVTQDRNTQISDWLCRLPPASVISGRDRIRISDQNPAEGWYPSGGALYEVVGPPERFDTHVHANLIHIEGG
jgi:hypothetical protein